jgi:hypothetical protein
MPSYENLVQGLGLLACGVGSGAAVRLYCQSLRKRYSILFAFLCFNVCRSFVLIATGWLFAKPHNAYAWIWVLTEPLVWLFYVLVVLELYSLVLQNYKGLQTVGRWAFLFAITFAVLVSAASVLPTLSNAQEKVRIIFYYALIARGIMFSLVLFILLILFLLSWYPIVLCRNLVIHAIVCTIFLISASMGYLVRNVGGTPVTRGVNIAHLVITIICWGAWMLLTAKGEETKMRVRREFTAEDEQRLVDQLTAINSSLLRAGKKKSEYSQNIR